MTRTRGPDLQPRKNALPPEIKAQFEPRLEGESDADFRRRRQRVVQAYWRSKDANRDQDRYRRRELYCASDRSYLKAKAWQKANPEKLKAYQHKYYEANKVRRCAALWLWKQENAERFADAKARWYDDNQGLRNAYSSARRARERQATPKWADLEAIELIYIEAARMMAGTGEEFHVDHIVPLAGENVCGLHVDYNLRIITAQENLVKHNKLLDLEDLLS